MTIPNSTCFELVKLVHDEVKFPLENRLKLTTIFNAWVEKHIEDLVEEEHQYIQVFGENPDHDAEFKILLIRSFVRDSKNYDNHMWLNNNLR